ncbi:MAG: tRNA pseudouridine(38-40) synthase TruA [Firmicutes bacterium]|nr:tRNA pseudouridine(38-40) synthase TruA [Bacillota bacterium]
MGQICLVVSYDGTAYGGFQIQKNAPTIQGELERALAVIYKEPLRITGAGRTDAGVHARGQVVHYTAPFKIPAAQLPAALNVLLPPDIVVLTAAAVGPDFHACYDARRKIYRYTLDRAPYPQVMRRHFAYHLPGSFNCPAVEKAARVLTGTHDFQAFRVAGSAVRSTVRTLYRVQPESLPEEQLLLITFEGDGFLYRMVRMLVGSLLRVGRNRLEPEAIAAALAGEFPEAAGPTAPPQGLSLEKVIY